MQKNETDKFRKINYRLIEEFNSNQSDDDSGPEPETRIPDIDDNSLYLSAQTREPQENINFSIKEKDKSKKVKLLNATIYNKKNTENKSNKFVDENTLNSYLDINDLKRETEDNVDILRSNISKVYYRSDQLKDLERKSDNLLEGASKFNAKSKFLKNKIFWSWVINFLAICFFIFLIVYLIIKLT